MPKLLLKPKAYMWGKEMTIQEAKGRIKNNLQKKDRLRYWRDVSIILREIFRDDEKAEILVYAQDVWDGK